MVPLENAAPAFGRLVRKDVAAGAPQAVPEAPPPEAPAAPAAALTPVQRQKQELRTLCLARIDPASVAALPQEALFAEVERMIAEIADGQRIGLSAREQREVAAELVDDMLGLGPLAPLLEDETVTDIMVNGPFRVDRKSVV